MESDRKPEKSAQERNVYFILPTCLRKQSTFEWDLHIYNFISTCNSKEKDLKKAFCQHASPNRIYSFLFQGDFTQRDFNLNLNFSSHHFSTEVKSKCLLTFELKINVQNLSTERIFQDFLVIFIQSMKKTRDQEGLPHTVWQK